jgi:hypothetical protein
VIETPKCWICGAPVTERDWANVGAARVWCCGAADCEREVTEASRAAVEQAALDAMADGYERYL